MHKNIAIAMGVGALLLVLGAGGFFVMSSQKKPANTNTVAQTANTKNPTMGKMSLSQLMGMSGNQTCTFSDSASGSSGTVYISGGKVRGDFMSKVDSVDYSSHLLSDSQMLYIWSDNQKSGIKTSVASIEQIQDSAAQQIDLHSELNYQCSSGNVDATKFAMPSGIIFTDYSDMMKDVSEMMKDAPSGGAMTPNNPADTCSVCETMESDAKAACKTALKCN